METGRICILPGEPDDANRDYLPERIRGGNIVVNENGNNSQIYPKRLREYKGILADEMEDCWYEYVPEAYDGGRPVPLVVSFHGGLMTGWGQAVYTSWTHIADREGFIVAFPSAHQDRMWTLEYDPAKKETLDQGMGGLPPIRIPEGQVCDYHDMKFVFALIKLLKEKYRIDEERVYIQGMSMGNAVASQLARHYGSRFAAAAGSGCPTDTGLLFDRGGAVRNEGGALDIMVSRMEYDRVPPYFSEDTKRTLMKNLTYWKQVNGCETLPQIRIRGDYNFVFYHGTHAEFIVMDVKNRDHGQTFDDAEYVWDYLFSGVRRGKDGGLIHTKPFCEKTGDTSVLALAEGCRKAWVNQRREESELPVFAWQKLKYHGLNGDQIVRGEYLYVPLTFLARVFDAEHCDDGEPGVVRMRLSDGTQLQFARGSVGCVVDNRIEAMVCEAVERDGHLCVPAEWFCQRFYQMHVSECDGVVYLTDHPARLSTYTAWILRELLS